MDILHFNSSDGIYKISAATAADIDLHWLKFKRCVGDCAESFCDYRCSDLGMLQLYKPQYGQMMVCNYTDDIEWKNEPPVFFETAAYNFILEFKDVEREPQILHKLKEESELFTSIKLGKKHWMLTAPLSFHNKPGIFELTFRYTPVGKAPRTDTFSFLVVSSGLDTVLFY